MSTVREEWIRYGAKDGVVETYFHRRDPGDPDSNGRDLRSLLNFLKRAFEISDKNIEAQTTKVYRILDSFFTMFDPNFVPEVARKLVDRATKQTPVQVLLADPTGEFASVRSKSIGGLRGDSATEISNGLTYILRELTKKHPQLFSRDTLKKAQLTYADTLAAINRHRSATHVEVRLYDMTPSGPMFFFPPVLVYGRFCAGRNSNELPWSIIVNDADCAGDLYSIYQEEFQFLWDGARPAVDGKVPREEFHIAIVCALPKPELEHVIKVPKQSDWKALPPVADDPTRYYVAQYLTKKRTALRVIAASPAQMGMPASTALAAKMVLRFNPRLVACVGIAAGARSKKQGYGDILAPNLTFDYTEGKIEALAGKLIFSPDPQPLPISKKLLNTLNAWHCAADLAEIQDAWGNAPTTKLQLHIGPLASGASVVNAMQPVTEVLEHWRKLIGLEMEAHGVHLAANGTAKPREFLCMKSICDFASKKTDLWQRYAAYTSAQLCYRFIISEWESLYL